MGTKAKKAVPASGSTERRERRKAQNVALELSCQHRAKGGGPVWVRLEYATLSHVRVVGYLVERLLGDGWMVALRETGPERSHFGEKHVPKGWVRVSITSREDRRPEAPDADVRFR